MTPALMTLAEGGIVQDPLINRVLFARNVNHYLGVQLWPWEVDELPEDLVIVVNQLMSGLPKMKKHLSEVDDWFDEWRKNSPAYKH